MDFLVSPEYRARKYGVKFDPFALTRRYKMARLATLPQFTGITDITAWIDRHASIKEALFNLGFADRFKVMYFLRTIYPLGPNINPTELETIHQSVLARDLSEEIWQNIIEFLNYLWSLKPPHMIIIDSAYGLVELVVRRADLENGQTITQTVALEKKPDIGLQKQKIHTLLRIRRES